MRVILFGATGMVGAGALLECIADPRVRSVLSVVRRPGGIADPKLQEIVHDDFFNYAPLRSEFSGSDACIFCLGVSSAGLSEVKYRRQTYDLTLAAARAIAAGNTQLTFCYVSGAGTDSSERGRSMWARVKGETENALLALPFKSAFMFRPGFIQPLKGVRSKTPLYRAFYSVLGPVYPVLRWLAPGSVTTTVNLGRALIEVAAAGYSRRILYSDDINRIAAGDLGPRT
jgi:uncharacterized protein YbjT (DUF2867 family)